MASPALLTLRPAVAEDRNRLANLLHFESHVHTHLDWRRPIDWIGKKPFLVAERGGRMVAALALPPDPPGVVWLRLFAVSDRFDLKEAWSLLWQRSLEQLDGKAQVAVAIPIQLWCENLLKAAQFQHTHDVLVLDWIAKNGQLSSHPSEQGANIRDMTTSDLKMVCDVDHASFPPLWHNSMDSIQHAFGQASSATVIENNHQVVAYQISTLSPHGLHLARLAVHPDMQGKHLALSLVRDLQNKVSMMRDQRLTVNTQGINMPSLALYKKAGFKLTGEKLPVFERQLG